MCWNDFERLWFAKSATLYQSIRTGSLAQSVDHGDLVLTVLCSTDCRHLYCASCLLDWWRTCEKPTCHTCHQTCLYPPARDCVHGLLVLAHEDSGEGTWVAFEGDDSLFRPFFPPVSQTFSTHNNRGHNEQGLEGSIQQESVVEVESALTAGGEGNWEKQVVVDEDESSV